MSFPAVYLLSWCQTAQCVERFASKGGYFLAQLPLDRGLPICPYTSLLDYYIKLGYVFVVKYGRNTNFQALNVTNTLDPMYIEV